MNRRTVLRMPEHLRTLPNQLSGVRLLLIPILWILAFMKLPRLVGIGLIVAGLTDFLDGFVARKFNQVTKFGSKLDSLADNLLLPSVLVWVSMLRPEILADHRVLTITSILVYASSLLVGWLKFRRFGDLHLYSSKAGGLVGYVFIIHALLFGYHQGLFYVAIGMFTLSSTETLVIQLIRSDVDDNRGSILLNFMVRSHELE
ncbi:MAG: CDP-alcohol phosphatidyltransferase family protein [Anaerolineae bacterium]